MKQWLPANRRTRLWLTLLVVVSLLFQQMAFAAYVCGATDAPARDAAMNAHCDAMPTTQLRQSPVLCAEHCASQVSATHDARVPNVPPLLIPAPMPAPTASAALSAPRTPRARAAAWRLSGIPPALRFRVLLI